MEIRDNKAAVNQDVVITRIDINKFSITYKDETTTVNLKLKKHEQYHPPYMLGKHKIKKEYFSVVHTGEGDGWDINRPCMASIIVFQEQIYLIDAGPNVVHTLNSLGITVNEITGLFHTHAHDDHFAGLTSLVRADRRLYYYATPMVRASAMKKLSSLMSFPEEQCDKFFIAQDLIPEEWNTINGLEVKPMYSPHPVETTIMFFRTLWNGNYKTYAHLADICTLQKLKELRAGKIISQSLHNQIKKNYLTPVDIKKIDAGGGLIHGSAEDFRYDKSSKILISHKSSNLTLAEKEIGSDTSFGMQDVLIQSTHAETEHLIFNLLQKNFPKVPVYEFKMFANNTIKIHNVGTILLKKGTLPNAIHILLNGLIEAVNAEKNIRNILTPGTIIGEKGALSNKTSLLTYRAGSFIRVLTMPIPQYLAFIERNGLKNIITKLIQCKTFLKGTYLFGDRITANTTNIIAQNAVLHKAEKGKTLQTKGFINAIVSGKLKVYLRSHMIGTLHAYDIFGDFPSLIGKEPINLQYTADSPLQYYQIAKQHLESIPIVRWKLLEEYNNYLQIINMYNSQ